MSQSRELAYLVLQYAPTVIGERTVNVALVLFDPKEPAQFCRAGFLPLWESRVLDVDPSADIPMIKAVVDDIVQRLNNPNTFDGMLSQIEDSFSSSLRVTERNLFYSENPSAEMERLSLLLM